MVEDLALEGIDVHSEGYAYLVYCAKEPPPELEASYGLLFEDWRVVVDLYLGIDRRRLWRAGTRYRR